MAKGKGRPILELTSIGSGGDPNLYRQSARRWHSHEPGIRLPLLSARPAVTFPAREHHRPLAGIRLYCLVTEAHVCEQLVQSRYPAAERPGIELMTCRSLVRRPNHYTTEPWVPTVNFSGVGKTSTFNCLHVFLPTHFALYHFAFRF